MKKTNFLLLLITSIFLFSGCKSEDLSTSSSFELNNKTYSTNYSGKTKMCILQLISSSNEGFTTAFFSIVGFNATDVGTVSITLQYDTSEGIDGDYVKSDENSSSTHIYSSWITSYSITNSVTSDSKSGNDATGTVSVKKNSANNYTVTFDLVFSDDVKASGNVKQEFYVQSLSM